MQYDVFANPIVRARRDFPFVASLQSNTADTGAQRVIAFLAPRRRMPKIVGRLTPIVSVDETEFVLMPQYMTNLPSTDLRRPVANIAAHRDSITAALDHLFLGI